MERRVKENHIAEEKEQIISVEVFVGHNLAKLVYTGFRTQFEQTGKWQFDGAQYDYFKVNYQV
jgi:hypothetical protein